jgi:hypothetical protein
LPNIIIKAAEGRLENALIRPVLVEFLGVVLYYGIG